MAAGDMVEGMVSAARANRVPFVQKEAVDALCARQERPAFQEHSTDKSAAACTIKQKGACATLSADVEREVQSALAALQSAGGGSNLPMNIETSGQRFTGGRYAHREDSVTVLLTERSEMLLFAGVAAQTFGAEVLYTLATSGDKDRRDMLIQQRALSIICGRVESGKLQVSCNFNNLPGIMNIACFFTEIAFAKASCVAV